MTRVHQLPTPRILPWKDWDEFLDVWGIIESGRFSDEDMQFLRVTLGIWSIRGRCPIAVSTTYSLVECIMRIENHEIRGTLCSPVDVQQSLASIINRFINAVSDSVQSGVYASSINELMKSINIPRWIVDVRHDGAHGALPSLPVLKAAASSLFQYIRDNYWERQALAVLRGADTVASEVVRYFHSISSNEELKSEMFTNFDTFWKEIDLRWLSNSYIVSLLEACGGGNKKKLLVTAETVVQMALFLEFPPPLISLIKDISSLPNFRAAKVVASVAEAVVYLCTRSFDKIRCNPRHIVDLVMKVFLLGRFTFSHSPGAPMHRIVRYFAFRDPKHPLLAALSIILSSDLLCPLQDGKNYVGSGFLDPAPLSYLLGISTGRSTVLSSAVAPLMLLASSAERRCSKSEKISSSNGSSSQKDSLNEDGPVTQRCVDAGLSEFMHCADAVEEDRDVVVETVNVSVSIFPSGEEEMSIDTMEALLASPVVPQETEHSLSKKRPRWMI